MKNVILFSLLIFSFLFSNCKKEPGSGGKASLNGKVVAKKYNASYTTLLSQYYAPNVEVFIIYGNEIDYGSKISTNYDGAYEFKYLRPGNYKIYTYSKDSTNQSPSGKVAVIKEINIPKNNSVVVVDDLETIN